MPATVEHALITRRSVKLIRRAEVTSKTKAYQFFHDVDQSDGLSRAEAKLNAHESSKDWHAQLAKRVALATAIVETSQPTKRNVELVATGSSPRSAFIQRRLVARQRAYNFVDETARAYELSRGSEVLPSAINFLLDLIKSQEYAVIDCVFEQLIERVTNTASTGDGGHIFPREGSFWIACLTLTKGSRKQLDLRTAFVNLLRAYAASILEANVVERLLRNVE